jgi:dTDP-4-dehydrorhamnose reductase
MSTRLYLTGADGMVGRALVSALAQSSATRDWIVCGVSVRDFDIGDGAAVTGSIGDFRPDVVVHAAANAIVDSCESDPKAALRVNVAGTRNVVDACRLSGSRLLYLSSDYVFAGDTTPPGGYREDDTPSPLSIYGVTKLAGERICQTLPRSLVVRTSWLFGGDDPRTDNVLALLEAARRGERVSLIGDQYSRPTYTADLARALIFLLTEAADVEGVVHVANAGRASWYDVGRQVLGADAAVQPIGMADAGFAGGRPRDSTLDTGRLTELGLTLPDWTDALSRYCRTIDSAMAVAGRAA